MRMKSLIQMKRKAEKAIALSPFIRKPYFCSACGNKVTFMKSFGNKKSGLFQSLNIVGGGYRKYVVCPVCRANDRMRWIDYVLGHETDIYTGKCSVLHIAPEECIEKKIRKNRRATYITGDIRSGIADQIVDITGMPFHDGAFDYIILNHVLEHVEKEADAMRELSRCLKEGGRLIFSVPVCMDRPTYEKKGKLSEAERLKYYGQKDHCRLYGTDIMKYMKKYGLYAKEYNVNDFFNRNERLKYRLFENDRVYIGEFKR